MDPIVIEVPSALGLRRTGLERTPAALREVGLHRRLGVADAVCVAVPEYSDVRDPDANVLNPRGISAVAHALAAAVDEALDRAQFPVVLGGDCSILLGPMLALRRRGRYGLVFIDGHADFQHPEDEPNGEVASLDLAIVTGRGPTILTNIEGYHPLVRDDDVALVGYRVIGDNDHFGSEQVRDTAINVMNLQEVRERGIADILDRTLSTVVKTDLEGFWVHLDVDVLDDAIMPAVDYRYPGGMSWEETGELLGGLLQAKRACGVDVTIFNPTLDRDGSLTMRLSDLVADSVLTHRPGTWRS
jgi:arginase